MGMGYIYHFWPTCSLHGTIHVEPTWKLRINPLGTQIFNPFTILMGPTWSCWLGSDLNQTNQAPALFSNHFCFTLVNQAHLAHHLVHCSPPACQVWTLLFYYKMCPFFLPPDACFCLWVLHNAKKWQKQSSRLVHRQVYISKICRQASKWCWQDLNQD